MFLSSLTLIVALALSLVAAWYSIIGLTAIFAAAVIPIVIMGGILEVAKVVVTLWLHEYWRQCRLLMKMYLVPAVAVLMLITSMGIFGFLSKAHSDQSMISGDVLARIAIYDEKIKTAKENIDANRRALKQMDEAVDQVMGRSTTETGAERSVQIRRQQGPERQRLIREIEAEQKKISQLNEERAPVAAEVRKVEAEVGPIKYIAALIYGDNPDANLLEAAVRWVIILLVGVFDPLAIMMLLAATESLKWRREDREPVKGPEPPADLVSSEPPTVEPQPVEAEPEKSLLDKYPYLKQGFGPPPTWPRVPPQVYKPEAPTASTGPIFLNWPPEPVTPAAETETEDTVLPAHKAAMQRWKEENPLGTLKHERDKLARGEITELPWMQYLTAQPEFGFGTSLPGTAVKGDTWMKTDSVPHQLYKFNGTDWITVDKNISDHYTNETAYVDYLIAEIAAGRLDPDLLSEREQAQVEEHLNKDKQ